MGKELIKLLLFCMAIWTSVDLLLSFWNLIKIELSAMSLGKITYIRAITWLVNCIWIGDRIPGEGGVRAKGIGSGENSGWGCWPGCWEGKLLKVQLPAHSSEQWRWIKLCIDSVAFPIGFSSVEFRGWYNKDRCLCRWNSSNLEKNRNLLWSLQDFPIGNTSWYFIFVQLN